MSMSGASMTGGFDIGQFSGAMASKQAAGEAAKASKQAAYLQWLEYQQTREDLGPWREAGANALNTLRGKLDVGPGEYQKSPYYNFLASEGMKGIERGAAARSGVLGGATQKALSRFTLDLASTDYNTWLNNWYKSLTPYQSMAGLGQTAAYQTGVLGANTAENAGNFLSQIGQYRAAGTLGMGNTMASGQNSLGQIAQQAVQNYLSNQGTTEARGWVPNDYWANTGYTPAEVNTMTWL